MAVPLKSLLGGRYQLSGETARVGAFSRGWDRWLNRRIFIEILGNDKIDEPAANRRFIDSAQALIRIEHPNIEALLDFGVTGDGRPYHVLRESGVELATVLAAQGRLDWVRTRELLLDVIAGVRALHRRRIVHGGVSTRAVALFGQTARLVEFADAELSEHELTVEQRSVDVRGIATLALVLLTGADPSDRDETSLDDELARAGVPTAVRAMLLRALSGEIELSILRQQFQAASRPERRLVAFFRPGVPRLIDVAASVAAVTMLAIGLWSSVNAERSSEAIDLHARGTGLPMIADLSELTCEAADLDAEEPAPAERAPSIERRSEQIAAVPEEIHVEPSAAQFATASARVVVGSEERRKSLAIQSRRFDLLGELSPASMVERGIDLTHGRPAGNDDPRVPILDGPERARELFEAACARRYGKGCHMLGVQIAEGMVPDDGAGPAVHYRRGCELDYHRSCAALADLARIGKIVADADVLDAKACRLAGADSSYCRPHT